MTTDPTALLTPSDLAERWSTSTGSLANMRHQRRGPAFVKLGALVRYRLADVQAFEERQTVRGDVA